MDPNKGHYDVLGLDTRAPAGQIERAYRFVREVYSDPGLAALLRLVPEELERHRARIDAAYRILIDPESRLAYDVEIGVPEAAPPVATPRPVHEGPRRGRSGRRAKRAAPRAAAAAAQPDVPTESPAADVTAEAEPAFELPPAAEPEAPEPSPGPVWWNSPVVAPPPPRPANGIVAPPPGPPFDGRALRDYRVARGVSLEQIEAETKIRKHYLENLEADRFDAFPAVLYLKGYLRAYCGVLGLDSREVADSYLSRVSLEPSPLRSRTAR